MKNIIIVGASGMVGSIVLREALASDKVASVTSLVRKASGLNHEKLTEIIHEDFSDLSPVLDAFKDKQAAYFCIGVYTGTVPDDVFKVITVDMAVAFGDALKAGSPDAKLAFLSGQGADSKEKSRIAFARYKGMAENHLLNLGLGALSIFRPGYIYPVEKREEPNFTYRLSRWLYPILGWAIPHVTSTHLGKMMFIAGMETKGQEILENKDIKNYH